MKKRGAYGWAIPFAIAAAMLVLWQMAPMAAGEKEAAGKMAGGKAAAAKAAAESASPGMSEFIVISPHTADQCLQALDATLAMPNGEAELARWDWGCLSGDHTGYLIVHAASADEALKHVPEAMRAQAKAVKLNKFTPEQIKSAHEVKK